MSDRTTRQRLARVVTERMGEWTRKLIEHNAMPGILIGVVAGSDPVNAVVLVPDDLFEVEHLADILEDTAEKLRKVEEGRGRLKGGAP